MKSYSPLLFKSGFGYFLSLILVSIASLVARGADANGQKLHDVDMTAVAERTDAGKALMPPKPDQPVYCAVYDGGYIEAGDPIAGEKPPSPATVSHALRDALTAQGYRPATPEAAASLVLTYHWGSIRPTSFPLRSIHRIDPNLKARLELSAPEKSVHKIEEFILDRKISRLSRVRDFGFLSPPQQDALDRANDDHYFIVVSAYDYAALTRGEKTLLWRVKLRARSVSGNMNTVLPALVAAGGPFLGGDEKDAVSVKAPMYSPAASESTGDDMTSMAPQNQTEPFDSAIRALLKVEHEAFSGSRSSAWDDLDGATRYSGTGAERPALPAALAARVATYQKEKRTLQDALAEKIKSQTPGAATSQAIDRFNVENAGRIATLNQLGETIRKELAQLSADNAPGTTDKSLDALRREFAADIRPMGDPSGTPQ